MEEWNVQIHAYNCLWVFDISETQLVFPVLLWLFIQNGIILSFYVTPICWRWLWWDFLIHHSGVQVSSHKWGCVLKGTGHTRNTLAPPGYLCYYRQYYSNNEYNMDCLHAAGRMRRFESLWFLVWCSNLLKLTLDRGLVWGRWNLHGNIFDCDFAWDWKIFKSRQTGVGGAGLPPHWHSRSYVLKGLIVSLLVNPLNDWHRRCTVCLMHKAETVKNTSTHCSH